MLYSYDINSDFDDEFLAEERKLESARILLIEDSPTDVFLATRMLQDISYNESLNLTDVSRLADALDVLDKASFDIVLLDLNLPDIDGIASVAALHAEIPNTPIIVYSSIYDSALREQAIICGARHYLVKGHDSNFLLKTIIESSLICAEV